jgi:hypothetical protein
MSVYEPAFRKHASPPSTGSKMSQARNQPAAGTYQRRFIYELQSAISQKMETFNIFTFYTYVDISMDK